MEVMHVVIPTGVSSGCTHMLLTSGMQPLTSVFPTNLLLTDKTANKTARTRIIVGNKSCNDYYACSDILGKVAFHYASLPRAGTSDYASLLFFVERDGSCRIQFLPWSLCMFSTFRCEDIIG